MDQVVLRLQADPENRDLCFKQTIIIDGTGKGRYMIEVLSMVGFRLLELPPELRERIYGFALPQPTTYDIKTYTTMDATCNRASKTKVVSTNTFLSHDSHRGQKFDHANAKWRGGPPSELSLLLVNKQIHAEATPFFYRSNCFRFHTKIGARINLFIETIGPSVQHLGEIKLDKVSIPQLKEVLVLLKAATGLRKLHLGMEGDSLLLKQVAGKAKDEGDPVSWACAFNKVVSNFLIELKKAYRASNRSWKAADVVQFVKSDSRFVSATKWKVDLFEETFREIARGYLED